MTAQPEAGIEVFCKNCLKCRNVSCACPVGIDIPGLVRLAAERSFEKAAEKLFSENPLAAVCGRACPSEIHCGRLCSRRNSSFKALERLIAGFPAGIQKVKPTGKSVAVIGSGPSGLTAAALLSAQGHDVTVFEALHEPGGSMLFSIPEFRLPKGFLQELIARLGVEIVANTVVGRTVELSQLEKGFDAVYIATGASMPVFPGIKGENLRMVYAANEFLMRVNLMRSGLFPEHATPVRAGSHAVVLGSGTKAIDSALVARRLGSAVTVVDRGAVAESELVMQARAEGVKFLFLTDASRILGNGSVDGVECVQMMPGPKDESGVMIPVRIENSHFILACDMVVVSAGDDPTPVLVRAADIRKNAKGAIIIDEGMRTSREGVFAGGNAVKPSMSIAQAISDGRKAAMAIDEYLRSGGKQKA